MAVWLVIHHVLRCGTKLLVTLDHLVHSIKEIFFSHCFPTGTNGIHPSLCAYTPYIRSCDNKQVNVRTWLSNEEASSETILQQKACWKKNDNVHSPVELGQSRARSSKRMSRSQFMVRVCILKIWVRPSRSGSPNSTFLSRRPGRRSAGSKVSGLQKANKMWSVSRSHPYGQDVL